MGVSLNLFYQHAVKYLYSLARNNRARLYSHFQERNNLFIRSQQGVSVSVVALRVIDE